MAFNVHSDRANGHGSDCKKSLLSLSDDVLIRTLISLTLEERIGIERTSKRIKAVIDQILSLQKIFAIRPRNRKYVLMKSWSPLQSRILCSKARLFHDTLPWHTTSSLSILSRCSSVKLVNLNGVDVCGTDLATWCPLITHFASDNVPIAADYVQELMKNKKDVLIESFECQSYSNGVNFSFLSNCSKLNSLICQTSLSIIPHDVLSKVKTLSFGYDDGKMNTLYKCCSKNLEQLSIRYASGPVWVQKIADNFENLIHLETRITIKEFNQLIKLRKIQSIKAVNSYLNHGNIATFEQFLSANGAQLKNLWITMCEDGLMNRAIMSLSVNCPNLIRFKIDNGIKLKEIKLETIKLLPPLEKINLDIFGFTGSPQDVEKMRELLQRCKNSMRKVSLTNTSLRSLVRNGGWLPIPMELPSEIIRILREHKRTGGSKTHNGKPLSRIECDGKKWNGPDTVNAICVKMSFYY